MFRIPRFLRAAKLKAKGFIKTQEMTIDKSIGKRNYYSLSDDALEIYFHKWRDRKIGDIQTTFIYQPQNAPDKPVIFKLHWTSQWVKHSRRLHNLSIHKRCNVCYWRRWRLLLFLPGLKLGAASLNTIIVGFRFALPYCIEMVGFLCLVGLYRYHIQSKTVLIVYYTLAKHNHVIIFEKHNITSLIAILGNGTED